MTQLLDSLEATRHYTVTELEQVASKLKLSDYTIHNLLNYGVNKNYIIEIKEDTTAQENQPIADSNNKFQNNTPSSDDILSSRDIRQKIEDSLKRLEEIQQENLKYAELNQEIDSKIAELTKERKKNQEMIDKLCREEKRLTEIFSPFCSNSSNFQEVA